jgi:hypothetical protein
VRAEEARRSAATFLSGTHSSEVTVFDFPYSFLPFQGALVKQRVEELKLSCMPDLILTHHDDDRHQDHRLADVVPNCRIEVAPDAGPDKRSYRVSFEKIARLLPAFKPEWDARRGAEQLYAAYRLADLALEEFEGSRYQRISHIQRLMADGVLAPDLRHRRDFTRAPQAAE